MSNENFLMWVEILHVMEHSVWTIGHPTMLNENLLIIIFCVMEHSVWTVGYQQKSKENLLFEI